MSDPICRPIEPPECPQACVRITLETEEATRPTPALLFPRKLLAPTGTPIHGGICRRCQGPSRFDIECCKTAIKQAVLAQGVNVAGTHLQADRDGGDGSRMTIKALDVVCALSHPEIKGPIARAGRAFGLQIRARGPESVVTTSYGGLLQPPRKGHDQCRNVSSSRPSAKALADADRKPGRTSSITQRRSCRRTPEGHQPPERGGPWLGQCGGDPANILTTVLPPGAGAGRLLAEAGGVRHRGRSVGTGELLTTRGGALPPSGKGRPHVKVERCSIPFAEIPKPGRTGNLHGPWADQCETAGDRRL